MPELHRWDLQPAEARELQRELAEHVRLQALPCAFRVLGAADISYVAATNQLVAVMVTFQWPDLTLIESSHVVAPITFPYIPGLLSFREIPSLLEAHRKLQRPPEVLLCDGQGIAHPRRFGLASHLGLCLDIPTVGCAKKLLCGKHDELERHRGCATPLRHRDEAVGWVFRSRDGVKPIYISPGHLSDLESSKVLIQCCLSRFRIPEPLRQAHNLATQLRKALSGMEKKEPYGRHGTL
jgi:deoxyribonuclease V